MKERLTMILAGLFIVVCSALAQTRITGTVVSSEDGQPITGASIKTEGSKTGAVTDIDGRFTIDVKEGTPLTVSYLGMVSKTVKAQHNLRVVLAPDSHNLDEVMVVAYGTAKKSAFTGSAAVLKSDDIKKTADSNPVQSLTGKVSGVQINSATGQPGQESFNILIRGISSINAGTSPLIIVDGAPYDGDLNTLNSADIASMTVLKDAASAALYGARGANGVILITTKSGRDGSSSITVDAKWGSNSRAIPDYNYVTSPAKYYEMWYGALYNYFMYNSKAANGAYNGDPDGSYRMAVSNLIDGSMGLGYNVYTVPEGQYLIGRNGKINPYATLGSIVNYNGKSYMLMPDNWNDATYKNGLRQEYTITATGNNQNGSFYGSANYLKNEGITYGSDFERFSGRLKADYQLRSWIKLSGNFNYAHTNSNYLSNDGSSTDSGNLFAVRDLAPIYPLYVRDAQGNIIMNHTTGMPSYDYGDGEIIGLERPAFSKSNPLSDVRLNVDNIEGNALDATGRAEIRFLNDFTFTSANTVMLNEGRQTNTAQPFFGQTADMGGQIAKYHTRTWAYNYQQLLNWQHQFGKHNAEVMLGHEYYRTRYYVLGADRTNVYSVNSTELAGAIIDGSMDSYTTDYNTEGFFGRAQYNYDGTYFGSFSYRRDASSRFHPDHRWGNFWSAGAAWIISREKWFKAPWVDMLKIKASYGEQGNDNIGNYRYTDNYTIINSNGNVGLVASTIKGNKDITWEKNGNFNVGAEFSLFGSRLNGSVEYFYRKTTDMLASFSLPVNYGYASYYDNVGDMSNSGVEVELRGDIIRSKDFTWGANLNFTAYKNTIDKIAEENRRTVTPEGVRGYASGNYFYGEGKSIYNWYMYKFAGVDEKTGDALYYMDVKDKDGNVTRQATDDTNAATRYLCGSALPWSYGGFGTNFAFKGFDLSVDFTYQLGGKVYDSTYAGSMVASRGYNMHVDLLNAWTADNTHTNIPRMEYSQLNTTSDRFLTSASYLCLQNVNFGYTLPSSLVGKIGVGSVRFYVTGANLWLWSKRQGLDPRQSITGATTSAYYSPVRSISGGLTVTF